MSAQSSKVRVVAVSANLTEEVYTVVRTFEAAGTIDNGDVVSLDITQTTVADRLSKVVVTPAAATGGIAVIGIAYEEAVSGDTFDVIVAGFAPDVAVDTAVSATGKAICVGNTAAGQAVVYASGTHTAVRPFGFLLTTVASNLADVWLYPTCV